MSKPKEFWIDTKLPAIFPTKQAFHDAEDEYRNGYEPVHVIEYSAYQALKEENEELKKINIDVLIEALKVMEAASHE